MVQLVRKGCEWRAAVAALCGAAAVACRNTFPPHSQFGGQSSIRQMISYLCVQVLCTGFMGRGIVDKNCELVGVNK